MTPEDRVERWLIDLAATLDRAADVVARGEDAYRNDVALPLAFEALSNRVGDLAKSLVAAQPDRFADPIWRQAARNRDFVVHHYGKIDLDLLWATVSRSFPLLRDQLT